MEKQFRPGDSIGSYINSRESYTVLEVDTRARTLKVRSSDESEFWMGMAMAKPIAQDAVQE